MNLTEAIDDALSKWYGMDRAGVSRPITHQQGLTARLNALQKAFGDGQARAARHLGISPRTWQGWTTRTGKRTRPGPANRRKIESAYQQLLRGQAVGKRGRRTHPSGIGISAVIVFDPGTPDEPGGPGSRYINRGRGANGIPGWRTFHALKARPGDLLPMIAAWGASGPQKAAQQLEETLSALYPPGVAFEGDDVKVSLS